jgi:hypothetical protein
MFSNPFTVPAFWDGWEAFCLGGFSALGLRASRLDFFWDLAILASFMGGKPWAGPSAVLAQTLHK